MTRTLIATAVLSCVLAASALAQSAAPATAPADPIVAVRAEQRAANSAYAQALIKAHSDRSAKVDAAVVAAVKDADAKGADPLVAKRNAEAKARKATQAEYDTALKAASADRKAALAAADKKLKAANPGAKPQGSSR